MFRLTFIFLENDPLMISQLSQKRCPLFCSAESPLNRFQHFSGPLYLTVNKRTVKFGYVHNLDIMYTVAIG